MGIASVVPHLPRLINKRGLPLHLTFFVTARCNALCKPGALAGASRATAALMTRHIPVLPAERR